MPATLSSLHLVGDSGSSQARAALAAWRQLERRGAVRCSADLAAATMAGTDDIEVVVLLQPSSDEIDRALKVVDQRGLPRWAVVPGSPEDMLGLEAHSADARVEILTRSIRAALAMQTVRRENARLRGDLATIGRRIAHDLRTPLNSINMASHEFANRPVTAQSAALLRESISSAVSEAAELIERVGTVLLASARPITLQPVNMEEVVWNALQTLDSRIRAGRATVSTSKQWPVVMGDAELLEVVWTNLLMNALQHGETAPQISLGWERVQEQTRFWIRDNGSGVAANKRTRLFHPLDRLNELSAPRGYGLYSCNDS